MKAYFLLLLSCLFLASCGDSIQLGANLVEDTNIEVGFNDTLTLSGKTIGSEPPVTYRNGINFIGSTYMVGTINDPYFGSSTSTSYFSATLTPSFPEFGGAVIDSVILALPLDTMGQYGDPSEVHTLELYQLNDVFVIEPGDTLFSNQELDYDPMPLATFSGVVNHKDSLEIFNPREDTILGIIPQLRFELDPVFWNEVMVDTLIHESDESLTEHLKGFALRSVNAQNSMVGLALDNNSPAAVEIYYSIGDSIKEVYFFDIGLYRHHSFNHDYSGSEIEVVLDQENMDDKMFLQSMAGTNVELDLSSIDVLGDEIINRAVLEVSVENNGDFYPPINQILASYYNNEGELRVIEDANPRYLSFAFDGSLRSTIINGSDVYRYELRITNHINNIINGEIADLRLVLTAIARAERPNQSVLLGPESSSPPVLKLITTKP